MASTRLERIGTIFTRVQGLITKGAIRPDDRPLWFDVYRAFPPITEPKFAKPKPEIKPIRQILYPEDAVRAKFHSQGHGLAAISIISQSETPTKRLVQQYEKLKAEGVPEAELVQKSVEVTGATYAERQVESPVAKATSTNRDSVTSKVLAEADLKNIFKE
ncbi:mitochondrial ribosomal protein S23 [Anticarsia gemmatalis]|uniref:mitochondrial ribosomal protein S23 n=1 Tax=Anticarsia gemmatalis TaxID=129554 RepID=UPI003F76F20C